MLEPPSRNRSYFLSPWRDWDKFLAELVKIVRGLDREPTAEVVAGFPTEDDLRTGLPTQKDLKRARRHDLVTAIEDFYGGFTELRKKLGFPYRRRGEESLTLWPNFVRELCAVMRGLDEIPSEDEAKDFPTEEERRKGLPSDGNLIEIGRADIADAIRSHHGGYVAVQKRLGFSQERRVGNASLKHWENMRVELYQIIRETDEVPSEDDLAHFPAPDDIDKGLPPKDDFLKGGRFAHKHYVIHAINVYYGGFSGLRERLGMPQRRREGKDSLMHWDNLIRELYKFMRGTEEDPTEEDLARFPSEADRAEGFPRREDFDAAGKRKVHRAIEIHHGGLNAVQKRLGFTPRREYGYRDTAFFLSALIRHMRGTDIDPTDAEVVSFPSSRDLARNFDRADLENWGLYTAANVWFGGVSLLQRKLGFPTAKNLGIFSIRHWHNVERAFWAAFGKKYEMDFRPATLGQRQYENIVEYHGMREPRERFKSCAGRIVFGISQDILKEAGIKDPAPWDIVKWRVILEWLHGLNGNRDYSTEDIAEAFSMSPRTLLQFSRRIVRLLARQETARIDAFLDELDGLIVSAWDCYRERRRAEAVEKVQRVLELMPDNTEIRMLRKLVIVEASEGEEVVPDITATAAEIKPAPADDSAPRSSREEWQQVSRIIPDVVLGQGIVSVRNRHMTKDEAAQLALLAQRGNRAAREALLSLEMPVARAIARQYAGGQFEVEDLVSVALVGGGDVNRGLAAAIDKCRNPSGFRAFAGEVMKNAVLDYIKMAKSTAISLDQSVVEDGDELLLADVLADKHPDADVENALIQRIRADRLNALISEVRITERSDLRNKAVFYFHCHSSLRHEQIGDLFGISRPRVTNIINTIQAEVLRKYMEEMAEDNPDSSC